MMLWMWPTRLVQSGLCFLITRFNILLSRLSRSIGNPTLSNKALPPIKGGCDKSSRKLPSTINVNRGGALHLLPFSRRDPPHPPPTPFYCDAQGCVTLAPTTFGDMRQLAGAVQNLIGRFYACN